jgi:hypothetical protein
MVERRVAIPRANAAKVDRMAEGAILLFEQLRRNEISFSNRENSK